MKKNPIQNIQKKIPLIIIGVLVVLNIFLLVRGFFDSCDRDYSFINPRFKCERKQVISKGEYIELKSKLLSLIEENKAKGGVSLTAIYFRDLEAGPTMGINDRIDFIPASLLKLPLAMTFLELAEDRPDLMEKTIVYGGSTLAEPSQAFSPESQIKKNIPYTINELIRHSIVYSDNVASQLLYEYLLKSFKDGNLLAQTYRNLGILETGADLNMAAIGAKGYGSVLRILYNASFLNQDNSEKLLSLLGQSTFKIGINQGVPSGIAIAHKFGERSLPNGEKQLHDCGIVYYPGNPYLLCVMTKGNNFEDLKDMIGIISKEVYEEVNSRKIF